MGNKHMCIYGYVYLYISMNIYTCICMSEELLTQQIQIDELNEKVHTYTYLYLYICICIHIRIWTYVYLLIEMYRNSIIHISKELLTQQMQTNELNEKMCAFLY
jgi:hypothetical protein